MCDRLTEWRTAMDLLIDKGITVKALAETTGIPETTVYSYFSQSRSAMLNVTAIVEYMAANGAPYVLASMCHNAGGLFVPVLRLPNGAPESILAQGQTAVNAAFDAAKEFFTGLADGEVTDTEYEALSKCITEAQSELETCRQVANTKRAKPSPMHLREVVLCGGRR